LDFVGNSAISTQHSALSQETFSRAATGAFTAGGTKKHSAAEPQPKAKSWNTARLGRNQNLWRRGNGGSGV